MNIRQAQAENIVDYSAQKDFYDPTYHGGNVTVVGAGGIGSPTVIGLARLGIPRISVYDFDIVEPHNVAAQNYDIDHVGMKKVDAIVDQARKVCVGKIKPIDETVKDSDILTSQIVVSAVDSMQSRANIANAAQKSPYVEYLLDGRLGGELMILHVVNLSDKDHLEYYLSDDIMFDDSEVESQSCTARSICDVSFAISALIVRSVRKILTGQDVEKQQIFNMKTLEINKS